MRIKILWGEKVVNVSVRKKKKNGSSSVHIKVLGVIRDLSRRKLALGESANSCFSFSIFILTNTASVT